MKPHTFKILTIVILASCGGSAGSFSGCTTWETEEKEKHRGYHSHDDRNHRHLDSNLDTNPRLNTD